jgi:phage gp29-like protein
MSDALARVAPAGAHVPLLTRIWRRFTESAETRQLRADVAKKVPSSARWYTPASSRSERGQNLALDATPPHVVSILSEAETGRTSRMIDLFKSARALDSRLDAPCRARVLTLTGRPLVFKPPPGFESDAEAKKIAANVTRAWNRVPHSAAFLAHLHHAALESIAAAELAWVWDANTEWWIPIPQHAMAGFIHSNRLGFNDAIEPTFVSDAQSWPGVPLSNYAGRVIVHAPTAGYSDYPWRRGAMRSRIIPSLIKRNIGIRGWMEMVERWGQPQVVAKTDDATLKDAIIEALKQIGIDWRAAFPKDTEVEAIDVSVDADLHPKFIDKIDTDHAITILGQNLTTEVKDGGSFAAAAAHNRVRYDILAADAIELAETITHGWVELLVAINWPGAPVPYAEFVLTPRRELKTEDFQAGLCTADEWRLSNGHEQEPDGRGARYASAQVNTGTSSRSNGAEPSKPSDTGEPGPSKPAENG